MRGVGRGTLAGAAVEALAWAGVAAAILAVVWAALSLADAAPSEAFAGFVDGAFGGRRNAYLMTTISRAGLIVGMAMAALIAFRAGLFNIGGEGQLVAGGLVTAIVAVHLPGPAPLVVTLAVLGGMVSGALWAMLAGALQLLAGVPLLIGSLLLNYPIVFLAAWLVGHPLRDVASGLPQTALVPNERWLPYFPGTRLDVGVLFVVTATVAILVHGAATVHGLKSRLTGLAPAFARAAGFPTRRLALETLAASGAVAGLVGAVAVLGQHHRFTDGMLVQPLYAWSGIIAVLLVGLVPWAVPIAGFFFAALATGAAGMERTADVPREIALVVQASIILFVAGRTARAGFVSEREG